MKQTLKLLAAVAMLGLSVSAMAQPVSGSTGTTVTVGLNVVCPITMTGNTVVAFGSIVGGEATATTITIAPQSDFSETYGAGTDPGTGNYGTRSQGTILLTGAEGFAWALTAPPSTVHLTGPNGSDLTSANLSYSTTNGTLSHPNEGPNTNCDGHALVYIGGSIAVDAGTGAGAYSGTVNVTAAYN